MLEYSTSNSNLPKIGLIGRLSRPSKPPVTSAAMLADSSSSPMVQSVSISSVSPVVRSSTSPEARPTRPATIAAMTSPEIGSVQISFLASMPTV